MSDATPTQPLRRHARAVERPPPLATIIDTRKTGHYRGYAELVDEWCSLVDAGARARPIGASVLGAPLFALEIGPVDATQVSVAMAGIHPIEWIGVEVMLGLLSRLVAEPPQDRRVIAFPLINVDGYRAVERDLRAGRRRWHRTNAGGVDLNRNWPTHFAARKTARRRLGGYNHGGPRALSEPEVACVVETLDRESRATKIDRALSLHSIGQMILTPYGGVWRRPSAHHPTRNAARQLRSQLGPRYTIRQSARWVPGAFARGMELDHLHDAYGATALLVECTYGGATPLAPTSLVDPFRIFNPGTPHHAVAKLAPALESFLRG